jgi:hypothetical protein
MNLRATIRALHLQGCGDIEIAEFLRCPHWYVRQCIGRPPIDLRFRNNPKRSRLPSTEHQETAT